MATANTGADSGSDPGPAAKKREARSRPLWLFTVLVAGPSMVPTLRHGDALLVRRASTGRPGDVAVVRFGSDPSLYVKRLARPVDGGWWALGDNAYASSDSRVHGPARVVGRVLLRWWPRLARVRCKVLPGGDDHDEFAV